eukprot:11027485-Lingulodinium_polyedra.AAC.1
MAACNADEALAQLEQEFIRSVEDAGGAASGEEFRSIILQPTPDVLNGVWVDRRRDEGPLSAAQ